MIDHRGSKEENVMTVIVKTLNDTIIILWVRVDLWIFTTVGPNL